MMLLRVFFTLFEADGVSASNLRMMLQTHNNMRELDSNFKAFELLVIAPEGGFDATSVNLKLKPFSALGL